MKTSRFNPLLCAGLLLCRATAHGFAQSTPRTSDVAWTRDYAIPYTTAKQSAVQATVHQQMNLSPRFVPMLRAALPQRQWFWKVGGKYGSVAEVAQEFIGVPGRSWDVGASAWLDDNRYVTEEGCVPHDCLDRGMLWIDTAPASSAMIFLAMDQVSFDEPGGSHLWVFVSSFAIGKVLPSSFQKIARRWNNSNQSEGYKQKIVLATIVTPDGGMRDVTDDEIFGKASAAGATQ